MQDRKQYSLPSTAGFNQLQVMLCILVEHRQNKMKIGRVQRNTVKRQSDRQIERLIRKQYIYIYIYIYIYKAERQRPGASSIDLLV